MKTALLSVIAEYPEVELQAKMMEDLFSLTIDRSLLRVPEKRPYGKNQLILIPSVPIGDLFTEVLQRAELHGEHEGVAMISPFVAPVREFRYPYLVWMGMKANISYERPLLGRIMPPERLASMKETLVFLLNNSTRHIRRNQLILCAETNTIGWYTGMRIQQRCLTFEHHGKDDTIAARVLSCLSDL